MVNCAAFTAVDAAESEPGRAHAVNAAGPGAIARACATAGARMIHISTDYVFDGIFDGAPKPYDVDDPTGPLSVYGKTKLAGEQAVHEALPDAHVVRTAWVYTGVGSDFVGVMRRLAAGDDPVNVVVDQIGSPTYSADLVSALLEIADHPQAPPLLHIANGGSASRYEQARAGVRGRGRRSQQGATCGHRGRAEARGSPAVFGAVRPRCRRGRPDTAAAVGRRIGRGIGPIDRPATLDAVSDELFVVTVTYSPGPHLGRFLATLSHATERPVTVIMADNGSTDGSPEEALERFPNTRLLRTGGNLGYGSAVNRAVAELRRDSCDLDLFVVANPDVQWGPGSIDALLEAAERWPKAASLGPLIRDPDGSVYPVGAPSAEHRSRRHARGDRTDVAVQPVDGGLPAGPAGAQRTSGRLAVGILPVAARCRVRCGRRLRRALLHVYGRRRPGRSAGAGGLAERVRADGRGFARQRPFHRP